MAQAKGAYQRKQVYVVDGSRTPMIKAMGKPGPFSASDLATTAARPLLARNNIEPSDLDEVILGCVMPSPDEANIGRIVALRLGCGHDISAWTVQRNCASGMQAIDSAARSISGGTAELVLAGGTESMSNAPLLFTRAMVEWLADWSRARTFPARFKAIGSLRPALFKPVIALLRGLTDPLVGLSMGQTAEILAHRFGITREQMDQFALQSHSRLALAMDEGRMGEIEPLYDHSGNVYEFDNGIRRDSSMEKLAKLKPVFDRKFGKVTSGNSSQITDGSACVLLASKKAVDQYKLPILGKLIDCQWAGLDPAEMGLGPVHAMTPIMQRQKLAMEDIAYWEINEAFAAQVLACQAAWNDDTYCKDVLNLDSKMGMIPSEHLNVDGGGICIGHPVGASGARIVLHLLNVLEQNQAKLGMASICIGGGQGGAMLVQRVG